jgi:hypothetical protein
MNKKSPCFGATLLVDSKLLLIGKEPFPENAYHADCADNH